MTHFALDLPDGVQPETRGANAYDLDASLKDLLALYLPAELRDTLEPHYRRLGDYVLGTLDDLAREADRYTPVLEPRDRQGNDAAWKIAFHPSYREMERIAFSEFGLAAMSNRAGVFGTKGPVPAAAKYAFTYLFSQAEFGLCCPINMTDLTARMLRKFGSKDVQDRYLPFLLAGDMNAHNQGTMWMTEKQGGSDVGLVSTKAEQEGDHWLVTGDKWFCSVANADMSLILARPVGAPAGTKGLGLFLVPRRRPDGSFNSFRCVRLKDKLGTRDMASGEMVFDRAFAWLIGPVDKGFKQMTDMINLSRLSNAVRAAGLMRRSLHEARAVSLGRRAFGRRLMVMPLMRRQLLKMLLPAEEALSIAFFTAELLDRSDGGDAAALRVLRMILPLMKFRACRDARKVAGDAMEVRGGSGYVEEWSQARVLRDAHLGSIWEGAGNVVALDALRAIVKVQAHEALGDALREKLNAVPASVRSRLGDVTDRAQSFIGKVAAGNDERHARQAASLFYHAAAAVLFAWEASEIARRRGDASRLLLARLALDHKLAPRDPFAAADGAAEERYARVLLDGESLGMAEAEKLVA